VKSQTAELRAFLLLAYALTWVLLGSWFYLFNVVYQQALPGWLWVWVPFAFIGGWGPSVAALILTARAGGRAAVRRLLRSLLVWRVPARWYVLAFALPPIVTAASIAIADHGLATLRHFSAGRALANVPIAYALALPFGPLGEELGWRGFALPRLLSRAGAVRGSLLLGAFWTFWHLPMMLFSPGASMPSFMSLSAGSVLVYLVQITAETALMTFLFLHTNASVLLAVLAHLTFNTAEAVIFGGLPRLPVDDRRAVYVINVTLLAALASIILVWPLWRSRRHVVIS